MGGSVISRAIVRALDNAALLGWHCVTLLGVKVDRSDLLASVFTGINSWGR